MGHFGISLRVSQVSYAFDLIELNGDDLRRDPLEVRKATLASKGPPPPTEYLNTSRRVAEFVGVEKCDKAKK